MIYLCISTIEPSAAPELAQRLVEERLAACVNILPGVRSVYRWQGEIRHAEECVLFIKISPGSMGTFEDRFKELHPYDCPELLMLPVEDGLKEYLRWVEEMTVPAPKPRSKAEGGN